MKMKHTIKLKSGEQHVVYFKSKSYSNEAFINALTINRTFNTIRCIWIEPVAHPEQRIRIDFDENGVKM